MSRTIPVGGILAKTAWNSLKAAQKQLAVVKWVWWQPARQFVGVVGLVWLVSL